MVLLGIDIGGTKTAVVLGIQENKDDISSLHPLDRIAFPTDPKRGVKTTLNTTFDSIEELLRSNGRKAGETSVIGISCGGPLDSTKGVILSPPNLPGWDNIPVVKILQDQFGRPVRLQNDASACALAEWLFGAGRGYSNIIFLTFGTGLGAGLILNGRLYSGTNDMAGEVGHVRLSEHGPVGYGKAGSFEGFCSGGGLTQLAQMKVLEKLQLGEPVSFCPNIQSLQELTVQKVAEAAISGDPLAREIFELCGHYLGQGLSILINILNPELIILGSVFLRTKELLSPAALRAIEKEALFRSRRACSVVPAGLGEEIGDYAALAVAVYEEKE